MTSKRKRKLEADIGAFVKQYKRKTYPTHDPNDRRYDRKIEEKIKHISPEELNELLYGEGEEDNDL